MERYLVAIIVVLLFMVVDQAHALRQLTQLNDTYSQTISDYWDEIQKCQTRR